LPISSETKKEAEWSTHVQALLPKGAAVPPPHINIITKTGTEDKVLILPRAYAPGIE